jgi:plastocyanin
VPVAALAGTTNVALAPEPFDSGFINPGAQFRQKLTVPGSYRYFCIPHEMMGMTGAIEVLP